MGTLSVTVLTSFTILLAYTLFISGANAKIQNAADLSSSSQQGMNDMQKRPTVWLKSLPVRRLKPLALYRRDFQPSDVEFLDDAPNEIEKRFDDYGHMRFGKRSGDSFDDDYGHLRFGR